MKYVSVDEYFSMISSQTKYQMTQLRNTIKEIIPNAKEVISYNMPAFKLDKIVVYYAAFKNHIGFYPTSDAIIKFKDELIKYKTSKGAIQFPLNEPLPLDLIKKIVKYRSKY